MTQYSDTEAAGGAVDSSSDTRSQCEENCINSATAGRMIGHLTHLSVAIWIIVTTPTDSLLMIEQFMWKLVCVLLNVSFYLFCCPLEQ